MKRNLERLKSAQIRRGKDGDEAFEKLSKEDLEAVAAGGGPGGGGPRYCTVDGTSGTPLHYGYAMEV